MRTTARMVAIATRVAFASMGILFVWAALLQLNDADPLRWIALYGGGAALCLASAANRPPHPAAGLMLALVAIAYGAGLIWIVATGGARPMYGEAGGQDPTFLALEQGREVLGLVLIAGAAVAQAAWSHRRRRRP